MIGRSEYGRQAAQHARCTMHACYLHALLPDLLSTVHVMRPPGIVRIAAPVPSGSSCKVRSVFLSQCRCSPVNMVSRIGHRINSWKSSSCAGSMKLSDSCR